MAVQELRGKGGGIIALHLHPDEQVSPPPLGSCPRAVCARMRARFHTLLMQHRYTHSHVKGLWHALHVFRVLIAFSFAPTAPSEGRRAQGGQRS